LAWGKKANWGEKRAQRGICTTGEIRTKGGKLVRMLKKRRWGQGIRKMKYILGKQGCQ